jgi:SSS family solute:Na+ symporter
MNPLIFLAIFLTLGIFNFIVGLLGSKNISTNTDYFLAGRNLGLMTVTFTLIATQLGGNMVLGTSQWAYAYGYYGILYSLGMSLGFLLLACGFASKLQQCNVATTAQIFEVKYNSPLLKKIASVISIISLWGILVSLVVSSRALIHGLDIHNELIFLLFWSFIIIYTMLGGLHAVAMADMFQVIFIVVSLGSIFVYCVLFQPEGLVSLPTLLSSQHHFSLESLSASKLLATFLMPALFALVEQDLAQRFFASRSQRIAVLAALCAGIFLIIFGFIPVYFGMQAHLLHIPMPDQASPFIAILQHLTNDVTFALAVCGVMAAITSTADSLLCAISSNLAQDFDLSFIKTQSKLTLSKGVTLFTGVAAIVASYFITAHILDIAIGSYELSVSCLLVPIVCSFYLKKLLPMAAFGAAGAGLIGFVLFKVYPIEFPHILITLALSGLGYVLGMRWR